ncbi:hypothetical protein V6N11_017974 [Hibiscus sabdariffa]|uniref:Uncharacterized protein n=1 Tax=Hibiscus sabdariffa TaxID=183260 RepID=A0ABR2T6Y6_9ROSI
MCCYNSLNQKSLENYIPRFEDPSSLQCPQCVAWQLVTLCCSGFSVCLNPYVNVVRLDSLSSYSPGGVSIKGFGLRSKAFEAFSLNS